MFNLGPPSVNVVLSGYTDYTKDPDSPFLAIVECYTMNSPPTTVTWKRDGVKIDVQTDPHYETLQVVVDRINSHYRSILLIRSVLEIMGNHTFMCEIQNSGGSTYHSVTIDTSGILIHLYLI